MSVACAADGCTNQAALVQRELGKAFCSQRCISDYRCDTHQYLKASPATYAVPIGSPLVAVVRGSLAAAGTSPDAVMKSKLHSGGAHYLLPVAHVDALIEQLKAIGPLKRGLDAEGPQPKQQKQDGPPTTLPSAASAAAAVPSSSSLSVAPSPMPPPRPGPAGMDVDQPAVSETTQHPVYLQALATAVVKNPQNVDEILAHTDRTTVRELAKISPALAAVVRRHELQKLSAWLLSLPPYDPGWGDIEYLSSLRSLSIRHVPFESVPPEIDNLTALESLYISHGTFEFVPPEIGNLTALQTLSLRINALTFLPPEIGNLTALQTLDLSINALTSLPPEIGNLTALQTLGLISNELTSLPPEIGNLKALQTLYLAYNKLASLPPEIGNLSALKTLHLDGNMTLTEVPRSILKIKNLTIYNRRGFEYNPLFLRDKYGEYIDLSGIPTSYFGAYGMKDITPVLQEYTNRPIYIGSRLQRRAQALQSDHIYIG